ncbi:MAG: hypothetical protein G8D61_07680 [gamma proteobacterium symbiont of Ctena orbiculata]|nr:hypothetical protein [Candidatus Thiodiazotropha taylori]MBT3061061.1 hypothetical protein [Candidatus Thiodiazotropha sp. (ex Lucina pensylvanica)]MBV2094550.1 hypothetical protein [Candidatus Thiodiazotropha sp. (ex Codakia orbicularis)]PUB71751.1 MAG: hypothetical protein DBP03_20500 [gamma proteobacterium symbiont of Ctena orbiculata]MBT3065132.1 hypothetical protein [Candidatus Thiodiazotropha sp. (ex Lucina pensylvanica)]
MPVSRLNDENRRAFLSHRRQVTIGKDSGETQIVYNLDMGRVHYSPQTQYLYFCNSYVVAIRRVIESVLEGLEQKCEIECVYLDSHRCLPAANRVRLNQASRNPVCVALRMQGIQVTTGTP